MWRRPPKGVEGITGLKINYYAMVNLRASQHGAAVGGLKLNVRDRIPIGGVGGPVTGHIEPGVQRLNGFQTLWFARSRESADDYSRMARQKCVMNAMLQQLSPTTVVTKFESIAKASEKLVTTDLPASELGTFAELAMKARSPARPDGVVRAAGDPAPRSPDIDKIHSMVSAATPGRTLRGPRDDGDGREGAPRHGEVGQEGLQPEQEADRRRLDRQPAADGYAANDSSDLSDSC